jgi:hypothetical protein
MNDLSWDMVQMFKRICNTGMIKHIVRGECFYSTYYFDYARTGTKSNGHMKTLEALERRGLVGYDCELELESDYQCEILSHYGIRLPDKFCMVAKNLRITELGRVIYAEYLLRDSDG